MGKVWYIYPKEGKLQGEANSTPSQQQVPRQQKAQNHQHQRLAEASTHLSQESRKPVWKSKKPPKE
jgi:hypothetical protein